MSNFDSGGLNVRLALAMSVMDVQTFEIYVDDDRYAVPTLHLVPADDEHAVIRFAQKMIDESRHHRGIEICVAGERIATLGVIASQRAAAEPSELT